MSQVSFRMWRRSPADIKPCCSCPDDFIRHNTLLTLDSVAAVLMWSASVDYHHADIVYSGFRTTACPSPRRPSVLQSPSTASPRPNAVPSLCHLLQRHIQSYDAPVPAIAVLFGEPFDMALATAVRHTSGDETGYAGGRAHRTSAHAYAISRFGSASTSACAALCVRQAASF